MASIVKRGGSYSVVYTVTVNGLRKQKWETYRTLDEAEQRKQTLDLCRKVKTGKRGKHIDTVEELINRYILLYGQVKWSLSTFQSNCGLIRNYILPQFGKIRLEELSPLVVAEMYRKFYTETAGSTVLESIHKLLHSAFEQAVLWDYIPRNPFHKAVLPKRLQREYQFLLPGQVMGLLKQCEETWISLAIHLAFAGTLRKGEILALTWQDIDWETNSVCINKTIKRVSREALRILGNRDVLYEFPSVLPQEKTVLVLKTPKTASSYRKVYLPKTLMRILHEFHQNQDILSTSADFPNLIFRYKNGRPIQEATLTKYFQIALEKAGLSSVPFHSLRHSSITYKLILSGGDIKAVQGDSGHAQASMIIERYGHVLEENRRNVSRQFETAFFKEVDTKG